MMLLLPTGRRSLPLTSRRVDGWARWSDRRGRDRFGLANDEPDRIAIAGRDPAAGDLRANLTVALPLDLEPDRPARFAVQQHVTQFAFGRQTYFEVHGQIHLPARQPGTPSA